jgi:hypothetical protein
MARALLEAKPLFNHFNVRKPSERVAYLIPECKVRTLVAPGTGNF